MHRFKAPGGTVFLYNGDYSGEVVVRRITHPAPLVEQHEEVRVPCDDLVQFVCELVRARRIAEIENADGRELLGLKEKR